MSIAGGFMGRWTPLPSGSPKSIRRASVAAGLMLGALLAGCAAAPEHVALKSVAKVEKIDGTIGKITLTDKAVGRIGIKTVAVRSETAGTVIPYSALIYDLKGDTYTYTNPQSLVYVRHSVRVKQIRGDEVILASGPAAGSAVVTAGASQLLGIELGIGS